MASSQQMMGQENPPELAGIFREVFPDEEDYERFLHDQMCAYESLQTMKSSSTTELDLERDEALAFYLMEVQKSEAAAAAVGNGQDDSPESSVVAASMDNVNPDNMSYEELRELGDTVGSESRGLSERLVSKLPSKKFGGISRFFNLKKKEHDECVICCEEFVKGQRVTRLHCKHRYHTHCITRWLQIGKSCPVCKREVTGR